ncbi:hypothetical protein ACN23B_20450 [Anabaena sp. FACHB-709]|uniref:Uncharacterized protein n=1 Tax=Anabaena cylindrica FACHB-318 TaxID=2692880 RepID=A0ABR7ZMR7_ANACY|nr:MULTISPECIES: hypothetical protein [Nostocaceae]MBD2173648.1 hypothetical protein [Anabaena cylindrica FACHB-318]MBD2285750.1 hypothetical protein [Anabaena cylindrica FACHB-170]
MYLHFLNFASSFGTCWKKSEIKSDRPHHIPRGDRYFPKKGRQTLITNAWH